MNEEQKDDVQGEPENGQPEVQSEADDKAPRCNHWHSEVTNSCAGRCMLSAGHHTNHGCGTCHEQW